VNEQEDRRRRAVTLLGYASFLLIGWAGVLVPALIRPIEDAFGQSDAGIGVFYLISAAFAALGQASGGLLTERVGRRTVLVAAGLLLGAGFAALALAPTWLVFLAAAVPAGFGGGAIDGGVNGLFLALHPQSRGGALNRLHLFFAIGALVAPFVAGRLVIAGIAWPVVLLATGSVALAVALFFGIVEMPSGRFAGVASAAVEPSLEPAPRPEADGSRSRDRRVAVDAWPFAFLAIGIGSYVAAEIGVSNWVVRFFDSAPLDVATGSLSLFWGGLTAGRLLSSAIADRFDPVAFAAGSVGLAAAALVGAVLAPSVPLSIALFTLGGVCFGPVYPMIMVVGGTLYPRRLAAVSGGLGGAAVVGGTLYPPLVGLISVQVGIGAGMLGAGLLSIVCAVALVGASLVARRLPVSATEAG
jgi:fucose permease